VRKEIKNIRIAFKIINGGKAIPPAYQYITCQHMIFDVNMEDFSCEAHFVAEGHTTDTPHAMMYTSVVPCKLVRIAFSLAELNDLDVIVADIEDTYLMAPIT
jgi:hypothetical protein